MTTPEQVTGGIDYLLSMVAKKQLFWPSEIEDVCDLNKY